MAQVPKRPINRSWNQCHTLSPGIKTIHPIKIAAANSTTARTWLRCRFCSMSFSSCALVRAAGRLAVVLPVDFLGAALPPARALEGFFCRVVVCCLVFLLEANVTHHHFLCISMPSAGYPLPDIFEKRVHALRMGSTFFFLFSAFFGAFNRCCLLVFLYHLIQSFQSVR